MQPKMFADCHTGFIGSWHVDLGIVQNTWGGFVRRKPIELLGIVKVALRSHLSHLTEVRLTQLQPEVWRSGAGANGNHRDLPVFALR